jgi:hypothetical protein
VAGVGQPQCVATGRPNRSPATVNLFRFRDPRYSRIVRQIREASAHYQVSTASLVPTFLRLGLVDRFSPLEILRYGLLSPSLSGPGRQEYRSKETSLELLRRPNPPQSRVFGSGQDTFLQILSRPGAAGSQVFRCVGAQGRSDTRRSATVDLQGVGDVPPDRGR